MRKNSALVHFNLFTFQIYMKIKLKQSLSIIVRLLFAPTVVHWLFIVDSTR